jgi:type IV pilus assembly protein PilV
MIPQRLVMISDNNGFTLAEFLVAIVILMVGLLGMLQGINIAMDKNMENILRNEAILVADDRMMLKRAKSFDALSTTTSNIYLQRFHRGGFKNYSVRETVSLATTNSKEVNINVTWKYRNKSSTHSVSTFVSQTPK